MNAWNKFGTINERGQIDARFYCTGEDVNVDVARKLAETDNRYDLPVNVVYVAGEIVAAIGTNWVSKLPSGWTKLVAEVKQRGPLPALATISDHDGGYRVRVDIEEN